MSFVTDFFKGPETTTKTDFIQSPQSQWLYQTMKPAISRIGTAISKDQPLYQTAQLPEVGAAPAPTRGWYEGLSPEIMAGVREPYQRASQDLMEQLAAAGVGGSATAGLSGKGAEALGKFWSEAGTQMGQQAWGMVAPGQMSQWQAELQRQNALWNAENQARRAPWQYATGLFTGSMPAPITSQQTEPAGLGYNLLSGIGGGFGAKLGGMFF